MTARFEPLASGVRIGVAGQAGALSEALQAQVDRIWEDEQALRAGGLFDGSLLSLIVREGGDWRSEVVPYRRLVAAHRDPGLAEAMRFQALAVTGCVECEDGFLIGKRASSVLQDAGQWEFLPAGGMEPKDVAGGEADPVAAFAREWEEETGAPFRLVGKARVAGFVASEDGSLCDLVVRADAQLSLEGLSGYHSGLADKEYSGIRAVPGEDLAGIADDLAEVSRAICRALISGQL